jgi:hypothetical protein
MEGIAIVHIALSQPQRIYTPKRSYFTMSGKTRMDF